ncbi:MAG: hypothetical protein JWP53_2777, partial [Conexibacter sp.]|nr:hypothetical protein [Conexibacter sp.]
IGRPPTVTQRWWVRQSMSIHRLRPVGPYASARVSGRSEVVVVAMPPTI